VMARGKGKNPGSPVAGMLDDDDLGPATCSTGMELEPSGRPATRASRRMPIALPGLSGMNRALPMSGRQWSGSKQTYRAASRSRRSRYWMNCGRSPSSTWLTCW
jgi:hypothetical protein